MEEPQNSPLALSNIYYGHFDIKDFDRVQALQKQIIRVLTILLKHKPSTEMIKNFGIFHSFYHKVWTQWLRIVDIDPQKVCPYPVYVTWGVITWAQQAINPFNSPREKKKQSPRIVDYSETPNNHTMLYNNIQG